MTTVLFLLGFFCVFLFYRVVEQKLDRLYDRKFQAYREYLDSLSDMHTKVLCDMDDKNRKTKSEYLLDKIGESSDTLKKEL